MVYPPCRNTESLKTSTMAYRSKTPRARQNPLSAVEKRRQRQSSRTITVPEIPGIPSDPNNPTSMNVIQTSAAQGDCAYLLWGGGLGTAGAPIGPNIELHINPPQVGQYANIDQAKFCLLYTSPSPRDRQKSRMPSSA